MATIEAQFIFFIILTALAFHLRGIWGHQIGGAAMGILMGFGLSLMFDLSLPSTISLSFWLAVACSISAYVGWANRSPSQQFLRGYLSYGALPNILMAIILFPARVDIWFYLALIGGLGMGIGFGLSVPLLKYSRKVLTERFKTKNPDAGELVFDTVESNSQASHAYNTKFNTWTYCMEVPSGLYYGITTSVILLSFRAEISPVVSNFSVYHAIYLVIILLVVFVACFIDGYIRRKKFNPYKPKEGQVRWSKNKFKKFSIVSGSIGIALAILFLFLVDVLSVQMLFLILLWTSILSARLSHEMDSPVLQIDFAFDLACGIAVACIACFLLS